MESKKLSVRMFGRFSAKYGSEVLTFGRQGDSKFGQLFQMLMTRPGQGFSKRNIAEAFYDWDKVEDPNASLNNMIFRLRKYLEASPLPAGEYLILNGGVLYFGGEVEVESDVWKFENIAQRFKEEQDEQKKALLCEQADELYQGEFLPHLSNEQWVIDKSRNYQKLYFEMMDYLLRFLKEEGDYSKLESLSEQAAKLYPSEGWEIWQIDGMIALNQYKEAGKLYQKTMTHVQRMDVFLSREQKERLRKAGDKIRQPEGTEEDIEKCLMETIPRQGAYGCTLQSFLDCFRMLKRVIKRGTVRFCLLLCTILDSNGRPMKDRKACDKQGKKLCAVFQSHLRLGDIYTKYCDGQYLLLCVDMGKNNISEVGARIDMDFRKRCGGRGGVSCRILDDGDMW